MQQHSDFEQNLIDDISSTLKNIQTFFKTNGVGQRDGIELLKSFLNFVFMGNAECGMNKDETKVIDLNSPEVQDWNAEVQPLVESMARKHKELIEDLFSSDEQEYRYKEVLRDGFLDTIIGQASPGEDVSDVTSGLVTCMIACHGRAATPMCTNSTMH